MPSIPHTLNRHPNKIEREFAEKASLAGWSVTKRGWPDFIIRRNGRIAFVEVKPDIGPGSLPSAHQFSILQELSRLGAECYVWSPKIGFRKITLDPPFKQPRKPSGKVGDVRGSQSPDASATKERAHIAGVKVVTSGRTG